MQPDMIRKSDAVQVLEEYAYGDEINEWIGDGERFAAKQTAYECLRRIKTLQADEPEKKSAHSLTHCYECDYRREENGVHRCQYSTVDLRLDGYCNHGRIATLARYYTKEMLDSPLRWDAGWQCVTPLPKKEAENDGCRENHAAAED